MFKQITFTGQVIKGRQMGRKFGIPTINLKMRPLPGKLKNGVYAVSVLVKDQQYLGLFYKGPRLILGDKNISLEIYLLDFKGDLYGKNINFTILGYIRGVKDFPNAGSYAEQIKKDELKLRNLLK